MADPAKDMVLFPAGGMSNEDAGDGQVQKNALEAVSNYDNKNADGDQKIAGSVDMFGKGPEVIQTKGPTKDANCAPGKGEGGY